MKSIAAVIVFFFFLSCTKDYKSNTSSYLKNETDYTVQIRPYRNGFIDSAGVLSIKTLENLKVFESNEYGKSLDPNYGTLLQPYDSVLVVFNNDRYSTHLKFNSSLDCKRCIVFSDNRNITNPANYTTTITEDSKRSLAGYFTYTFTEQDYLDAKK